LAVGGVIIFLPKGNDEDVARKANATTVPSNSQTRARESTVTSENTYTLRFNGESSCVEVADFDMPITEPVMLEAYLLASIQREPRNIVSWSGDRMAALFISSEEKFGIAYFDGERNRLVTSVNKLPFNRSLLLSGQWTGQSLRLFLNGVEVQADLVDYTLFPARPGLFIGGIPRDLLPRSHGTRFYQGTIDSVRVSHGRLPPPAKDFRELNVIDSSTVAAFRFDRKEGTEIFDSSKHQWRVLFHDTEWVRK
jgi:hypothetical protein